MTKDLADILEAASEADGTILPLSNNQVRDLVDKIALHKHENIRKDLLAALEFYTQFELLEGEDENERFERIGLIFKRQTGYLRPGKSCVIHELSVRQEAWDRWLAKNIAEAKAAFARAKVQP